MMAVIYRKVYDQIIIVITIRALHVFWIWEKPISPFNEMLIHFYVIAIIFCIKFIFSFQAIVVEPHQFLDSFDESLEQFVSLGEVAAALICSFLVGPDQSSLVLDLNHSWVVNLRIQDRANDKRKLLVWILSILQFGNVVLFLDWTSDWLIVYNGEIVLRCASSIENWAVVMSIAQVALSILKLDFPSLLDVDQVKVLWFLELMILHAIFEDQFIVWKHSLQHQWPLQHRIKLLISYTLIIFYTSLYLSFNVFKNQFAHIGLFIITFDLWIMYLLHERIVILNHFMKLIIIRFLGNSRFSFYIIDVLIEFQGILHLF